MAFLCFSFFFTFFDCRQAPTHLRVFQAGKSLLVVTIFSRGEVVGLYAYVKHGIHVQYAEIYQILTKTWSGPIMGWTL